MLINIQRYLVGLVFVVMIFIGAFHGMTDARYHHRQLLDKSHLKNRNRLERFG